jgi:uncharacterized protein (TIGR03083 family)
MEGGRLVNELWPLIHAQRKTCAEMVSGLDGGQLATPSLCGGWTVGDVAAHMIASGEMTVGGFYGKFLKAGFRFDTMVARDVSAIRGESSSASALGNRLAATGSRTNHPPGPVAAMLGEAIVHGEDMRRPLGLPSEVPVEAMVKAADFYKRSNLIVGTKKRIAGVRLRATDADWAHGEGPEASGPMLSLLLAMTGRHGALADLSGDGVRILAERD